MALAAVLAGVGLVGRGIYHVINDAFIAPMILSPDSDIVVEQKAKLTHLEIERAQAATDAKTLDADLDRIDKGLARLAELKDLASSALDWTRQPAEHAQVGVQLLISEAAVGQQGDLDVRPDRRLYSVDKLRLVQAAQSFERGLLDGHPRQRDCAPVACDDIGAERGVIVLLEVGPVEDDHDLLARSDHERGPATA
jgi:hypothetical protein